MTLPLRFPSGARGAVAAALAYLVVAVVWAAPSSLSPSDTVPDLGDPLHLSYVMAWDAHQLVRRPWALFDSNSFYPYARSLAFGDHLLPEALMVAPINWATGNAVLASNVGVVLALSLSGLTMFLLVRHLTGSWGAAFLSGLMYAFNSFTRHELLRVHVLNLEWWPLALLFLDRFVGDRRPRDAGLLAGALVLQGLSQAYYLVSTALIAPLWLVGAYLAVRRRPAAREAATLATALALAALPAALVLWPYVGQLRSMGFEKGLVEGADLVCYAAPTPGSWLWGGIGLYFGCFGLPHFQGFIGGALMLAGAVRVGLRRVGGAASGTGALAALTALVGLALSLGPMVRAGGVALGRGPFHLLYDLVPLARGMDGSKRMGALVILGGAVLAGLALAGLLERLPSALRGGSVAVLALLLPLEHWGAPAAASAVPTGASVPPVYRWLAEDPGEPVIELPLHPDVAKRYWAAYLYFSTYHWRPVPIGRTSFYPPSHDYLVWSLRDFPDDTSLMILERLGIRTLVVHPRIWDAGQRQRRLMALDAEPRLRLVRRFDNPPSARFAALGLGEERVYRLVGEGLKPTRPCKPLDELPREAWGLRSLTRERVAHAAGEAGRSPRAGWERSREWRTPWVTEWARDGDRRTAWTTAESQKPGDGLQVELRRTETVAAVALDLSYPYDEFPRDLVLVAEGGEDERRRLHYDDDPEERWETLEELRVRPREASLVLRLRPQALALLELKVGGRDSAAGWPRWSVPELRIYRDCR